MVNNANYSTNISLIGSFWLLAAIISKSVAAILVREASIVSAGNGLFSLISSPYLFGAYFSLGLQAIFWVLALRNYPLVLAYPIIQMSFVIDLLSSHFIFKESVGLNNAIGIGLITAGAAVVSVTSRRK